VQAVEGQSEGRGAGVLENYQDCMATIVPVAKVVVGVVVEPLVQPVLWAE